MPESKAHQIAREVRALIARGELAPGDQLPTESSLAAVHATSRTTVRDALAALEREGLVEARRPHGRFVSAPGPQRAYDHATVDGQIDGVAEPRVVEPSAALAKASGWPPDTSCLVRRWLTRDARGSAVHREVWWPLALVVGTDLVRPLPHGRELAFLTATGLVELPLSAEDFVVTGPLGSTALDELGLPPGTVGITITTAWRTPSGDAVRVSVTSLPRDRSPTWRRAVD
jgi:hypothetical protein